MLKMQLKRDRRPDDQTTGEVNCNVSPHFVGRINKIHRKRGNTVANVTKNVIMKFQSNPVTQFKETSTYLHLNQKVPKFLKKLKNS